MLCIYKYTWGHGSIFPKAYFCQCVSQTICAFSQSDRGYGPNTYWYCILVLSNGCDSCTFRLQHQSHHGKNNLEGTALALCFSSHNSVPPSQCHRCIDHPGMFHVRHIFDHNNLLKSHKVGEYCEGRYWTKHRKHYKTWRFLLVGN